MDSVTRQLILKLAGYPQVFPPKIEPFTKSNKGLNRDIRKEMHQESQRQSETQMRPPPGDVPMNKAAYELIQKLATSDTRAGWAWGARSNKTRQANIAASAGTGSKADAQAANKKLDETKTMHRERMEQTLPSLSKRSLSYSKGVVSGSRGDPKPEPEKTSSMRSIIDDIIKGAEQNTFGRPVNIQADTEFTPIDMAKVAGAVVALSEKGYSVKEASEYLGLTEKQIQDIVSTVG